MVKRRANKSDLEKFWREAIERQQASGMSIRAFCDAEGLIDHRFWYWKRVLKSGARARKASKSKQDRTRQSNKSQGDVEAPADWRLTRERGKKIKREEAFWSAILEEWQRSGLSLRQYAGKRMVEYKTLCRWRSKLLAESSLDPEHDLPGKLNTPQHDFVPVRLVGDEDQALESSKADGAKSVVEVVLKCGRVIRVSADCPLDFLSAVVSAVEVH